MIIAKILSFKVKGNQWDELYSKAGRTIQKLIRRTDLNLSYQFKQSQEEGINTLDIEVYTNIDNKDIEKRNCDLCKDMHCNFYINTRYNCDRCEYAAYMKRINERVQAATKHAKKIIKNL